MNRLCSERAASVAPPGVAPSPPLLPKARDQHGHLSRLKSRTFAAADDTPRPRAPGPRSLQPHEAGAPPLKAKAPRPPDGPAAPAAKGTRRRSQPGPAGGSAAGKAPGQAAAWADGSAAIPPALLHDPNFDTFELDPRPRWSELRDEKYHKEQARGEGSEYFSTEVDINNRRSWPKVAGLPAPPGGPRIQPPRLQQPSAVDCTQVTVFWHLTPQALEDILSWGRQRLAPAPGAPAPPAAASDGPGDPYLHAVAGMEGQPGPSAVRPPPGSAVQRLAAAAGNLRRTMTEAYAQHDSLLVFGSRELLDQPVGSPNDLQPEDTPESPPLGIALLPGDVPVPGGLDLVRRVERIRGLTKYYSYGELIDLMESLEAAEVAMEGAGKAGSRGTGPRPEEFDPWQWWRERYRLNQARDIRAATRPWEVEGLVGPMAGWAAAAVGADEDEDEDKELSVGEGEGSAAAVSEAEIDRLAMEEAQRVVQELGPRPEFTLLKRWLEGQRRGWERYRRQVEEVEGVPYEYGHLLPGLRRLGVDLTARQEGREEGEEGEEGGEGEGRQAARATARTATGPSATERRRQAVKRVLGGAGPGSWRPAAELVASGGRPRHLQPEEPEPPEWKQQLTVGEVLELCSVRLRRLPTGLQQRGVSTGRALLQELQAWVSREARRRDFDLGGADEVRLHSLVCVVSDDPEVLGQLPCTSLSGVEIILVTSDWLLGERAAGPSGAALLSRQAMMQGWYLEGSSLLSARESQDRRTPGRGFKGLEGSWSRREDWSEEDEDDPAFAEFLRGMKQGRNRGGSGDGGDDDDGEGEGGDGVERDGDGGAEGAEREGMPSGSRTRSSSRFQ